MREKEPATMTQALITVMKLEVLHGSPQCQWKTWQITAIDTIK